MTKVLETKMKFFEENTQGRILNRFSKDMQTLDNLVFSFLEMIDYFVKCTISLIIIVTVNAFIVLIIICSVVYLIHLRQTCIRVTQDPMRMKYTLMSPVNSLIQDAVNGIPTIRCLN